MTAGSLEPQALRDLLNHPYQRFPVADGDGLKGILSRTDIVAR